MALSLTDVQAALAESIQELAARSATIAGTRRRLDELQRGEQGPLWDEIVSQGLHAVHLPESADGMGGSVGDLAVAVEVAGETLLPGAFVPTVHASTLALLAGADDELLSRFAGGATAAVLTGDLREDGGSITGTSSPTIGALSAQVFVVVATDGDGATAYLVEADAVTREALEASDLTRDLGRVTLASTAATTIGPVTTATLDAVAGAIWGSEAAGLARASLTAVVEYARTRTQFGVPIGSFQATKHKAARMAVAVELAASAAWGAALSLTQSREQQALAGGAALLAAVKRAHGVVTDAVTIYGGIGFTWEHDVHLYLRRALSIAGAVDSTGVVARRLGEVSLGAERSVQVDLPDEDPAFRAEVGALLDDAARLAEDVPRFADSGSGHPRGPRREFLADHGLVAPHWPAPWGRDATPTEQVIVNQEFAARHLTPPTTVIGEWAMPTILAHGTAEQKERFGRPSLVGDIVWCQLFSEPGAGSDLAGLRTKAEHTDDGWVLNGQKVWTSGGHQSDWGICLARTDPDVPKHRGLSFFLVDMKSPGLTIRPLIESNGSHQFNEVFLDNVRVPDENLVGAPGAGWRIAMTTLQNERTSIGSTLSVGAERGIRTLLEQDAAENRTDAVTALGSISAMSTAIGSLNLAETLRRLNGLEPGPGSSLAKIATAELARRAAETAVDLAGTDTTLLHSTGDPMLADLDLPQQLIGGGTVEIQLNVVAERVLGLPRG